MTNIGMDPCPEGEEGVIDLGHGVRMRFTYIRGVRGGLIESHDSPKTRERCAGSAMFDLPEVRDSGYGPALWRVHSLDPLHIEPSLLCDCGHHGFIRDGRWVPA